MVTRQGQTMQNKLLGTITLEDFPPLTMPMISEQLIGPMLHAINQGMPPQEVAQLPTSHMLSVLRTLHVSMQQYATALRIMAHGEVYGNDIKMMSFLHALEIGDENLIAAIERDYAVFLAEAQSAFDEGVQETIDAMPYDSALDKHKGEDGSMDLESIISDMKSSFIGDNADG